MELQEVGADDDDAVRAVVALENARVAADAPWEFHLTPYRKAMEIQHGWDGEPARHLLVLEGGRPVAYATVGTSDWDNLDLAALALSVHPEHRRRGIGTRVLTALEEEVLRSGRHRVAVDGWESDAARGFAATHGLELGSVEVNRRMHLREASPDVVRAARADAHAAASGYELLRVVGATPDPLLRPVAELTEAINDAPTDDLDVEDERHPPERVQAYERANLDGGFRLYRLLARDRSSGELAGHSVVAVDSEQPALAHQHDTSVARPHRGHRLGLLLKAEMVLWLAEAEPQLEVVDTWNAASNAHMIAVNERLGYRVMGRALAFQRRLRAG